MEISLCCIAVILKCSLCFVSYVYPNVFQLELGDHSCHIEQHQDRSWAACYTASYLKHMNINFKILYWSEMMCLKIKSAAGTSCMTAAKYWRWFKPEWSEQYITLRRLPRNMSSLVWLAWRVLLCCNALSGSFWTCIKVKILATCQHRVVAPVAELPCSSTLHLARVSCTHSPASQEHNTFYQGMKWNERLRSTENVLHQGR